MAKRKRIGRPPKPPNNRKSVNFTFRSREEMREQLRVAADRSGRSISEEIEYRLNQSFQKELILEAAAKEAVRAVLQETEIWKYATSGKPPSEQGSK
jgi:Arc-like DNA binding domain